MIANTQTATEEEHQDMLDCMDEYLSAIVNGRYCNNKYFNYNPRRDKL